VRDVKRYVGGFVEAFPGVSSRSLWWVANGEIVRFQMLEDSFAVSLAARG
jgi:hypothetical protein